MVKQSIACSAFVSNIATWVTLILAAFKHGRSEYLTNLLVVYEGSWLRNAWGGSGGEGEVRTSGGVLVFTSSSSIRKIMVVKKKLKTIDLFTLLSVGAYLLVYNRMNPRE